MVLSWTIWPLCRDGMDGRFLKGVYIMKLSHVKKTARTTGAIVMFGVVLLFNTSAVCSHGLGLQPQAFPDLSGALASLSRQIETLRGRIIEKNNAIEQQKKALGALTKKNDDLQAQHAAELKRLQEEKDAEQASAKDEYTAKIKEKEDQIAEWKARFTADEASIAKLDPEKQKAKVKEKLIEVFAAAQPGLMNLLSIEKEKTGPWQKFLQLTRISEKPETQQALWLAKYNVTLEQFERMENFVRRAYPTDFTPTNLAGLIAYLIDAFCESLGSYTITKRDCDISTNYVKYLSERLGYLEETFTDLQGKWFVNRSDQLRVDINKYKQQNISNPIWYFPNELLNGLNISYFSTIFIYNQYCKNVERHYEDLLGFVEKILNIYIVDQGNDQQRCNHLDDEIGKFIKTLRDSLSAQTQTTSTEATTTPSTTTTTTSAGGENP